MSVDPKDFETKDMRLARFEEELAVATKERDALRIIASDHLAGSNLTVKPEDAADVANWAANPGAVRELLKQEAAQGRSMMRIEEASPEQKEAARQRAAARSGTSVCRHCGIVRAVGDLHELTEGYLVCNDDESTELRGRSFCVRYADRNNLDEHGDPQGMDDREYQFASRRDSDARGMEAVELEARFIDWAFDDVNPRTANALLDRSVGREPFVP